jgi:hypothetical protein
MFDGKLLDEYHLLLYDPCVLVGHACNNPLITFAQERKYAWKASGPGVKYGSGMLELLLRASASSFGKLISMLAECSVVCERNEV